MIILVVFDGLRRDMATDANTPTLARLLREGADFPDARSVFPTMTRVNSAAMASGCVPARTGIVANQFFDPAVFPDRLVHTGMIPDVEAAMRAYADRFVEPDSLGDILARHGKRLAVLTTASGGTTRMLNPRVATNGGLSLCLRDWESSRPRPEACAIHDRFGPPPGIDLPATALTERLGDIFVDYVLPEIAPDVAILWFGDPDYTFHYAGLGSPRSITAMQAVDAQLARIVEAAPDSRIVVASDHGHVNTAEHLAAEDHLRAAGFDLAPTAVGPSGAALQVGGASGDIADLAAFLQEQDWCGAIFTKDALAGTFDRALILNDHPRTPDLLYTLASTDAPGPHGIPGTTRFVGSELKEKGSTHGGLHRFETNTVLGLHGPGIRQTTSDLPCGVIDVAPTILHLLGLDAPEMSGRVLTEAFGQSPADPEDETFASRAGTLHRRRIGRHIYLREFRPA
ncbi:alkaline phosphatase family protein [Pontivivens ytuae]|uniref:Alkaline phosphatase family protein n=1 Tax=Pontivivens ytuae TaxID=2789856 RepID=A0A7S9QE24_9RHOB|nr:alkaline phosphatase family protein [Pontivivens ytuae]QPH54952.1 alkaline phosphatase family protein [Pontivivens ytuae]